MVTCLDGSFNAQTDYPSATYIALYDIYNLGTASPLLGVGGSISKYFACLSNLVLLGMNGFQLTGTLPTEMGSMNLWYLYLNDNKFTGSIPTEIGYLGSGLQRFVASNAGFKGPIPTEIGNLSPNLNIFDLSNNHLTGSLPTEIGNLNKLTALGLASNSLVKSIPTEIGNLNLLQVSSTTYSTYMTLSTTVYNNNISFFRYYHLDTILLQALFLQRLVI
jgi:Leucine-rich repeat (LRR) protein